MDSQENAPNNEGLPLYLVVRNRLIRGLQKGTWKPGDMLPAEVELAGKYNVSVGTVRQAILSLVRDGRLTRSAGRGTFVARLDSSRSFARFFRFRDAGGMSAAPQIKVLGVQVTRDAPDEVRSTLGLASDEPILLINRVLMSDETPICLYRSYLPYELVRGLEEVDLSSEHLYSLIELHCGIYVLKAEELLKAGLASDVEAGILQILKGAPVIHVERTTQTYGGRVLEWRETIGRSDTFHYKITMP